MKESTARTPEAIAFEKAMERYLATAGARQYLELAYHAWKETEG